MSGIRAARNLLRSIPRNSKATSVSLQHHNIMLASVIARSFSSSPDKLEYSAVPKSDFGKFFVYNIMLNEVSYMLIAQLFANAPGEYQEYSVIFTNRSLNSMSEPFQKVMRDLNDLLKTTYNAHKVAIMPG